MIKSFTTLGLASAAALALSFSAQAQTQTYAGNGAVGFGGPVGAGMLTFSSNGTTLTGTFTTGNNGGTNTAYDELVIYISTGGAGSNTTAGFTDDGGMANGDVLHEAISGYDQTAAGGTVQSIVNFAPGFNANYAIALGPVGAGFGALFGLPGTGTATANAFDYLGTANLTPTGNRNAPVAGPYTFSISLASIGSPKSFQFSTTYLNSDSADTIYRSNEAFNSITDTTTPTNTGNPGQDTVTLGVDTFGTPTGGVPEPSTWAMMLGGVAMLAGFVYRRRRA